MKIRRPSRPQLLKSLAVGLVFIAGTLGGMALSKLERPAYVCQAVAPGTILCIDSRDFLAQQPK